MKLKIICILTNICLLIVLCALPSLGEMASPSYQVPSHTFEYGVTQSFSENFIQIGAIGASVSNGSTQTVNFQNQAGFIPPIDKIPGDLDGNGIVDREDLNIIIANRDQPASVYPACDIDGDGTISVLDARKLVLLCTCPRCACP